VTSARDNGASEHLAGSRDVTLEKTPQPSSTKAAWKAKVGECLSWGVIVVTVAHTPSHMCVDCLIARRPDAAAPGFHIIANTV